MIKGAGNEQGNPVTSVNAEQAPGTISLHAALRRVIATTAGPDDAAHRAVGVFARWLRERARQQERERDRRIDPLAHVKVVGASWLADEIDAGTATAAEADAEIARLQGQLESIRADEQQPETHPRAGTPAMAEPQPLTDAEHRAMDLLAEMTRAMGAVIGGGHQAANDMREAVLHVHALQNMVLSQAAGRAYPDRYRLLGEDWNAGARTAEGAAE